MKLASEWKCIVQKAWSFRFMVLAGVFTTAETVLPYFTDLIPRGVFTVLTLVAVTGGLISRVIAQKGVTNDP